MPETERTASFSQHLVLERIPIIGIGTIPPGGSGASTEKRYRRKGNNIRWKLCTECTPAFPLTFGIGARTIQEDPKFWFGEKEDPKVMKIRFNCRSIYET